MIADQKTHDAAAILMEWGCGHVAEVEKHEPLDVHRSAVGDWADIHCSCGAILHLSTDAMSRDALLAVAWGETLAYQRVQYDAILAAREAARDEHGVLHFDRIVMP